MWCDPATGNIHFSTDDPDVRDLLKNTYISNKPGSVGYARNAYRRFATILRRYNKVVPGWDSEEQAARLESGLIMSGR